MKFLESFSAFFLLVAVCIIAANWLPDLIQWVIRTYF